TADLPRCVHHFDLNWLEQQDLLLSITDEDCSDIQRMSAQKAQQRGNHGMTVTQVDTLDTTDEFQERLYHFLIAVEQDEEFGENPGNYRSQRMHRFFAVLLSQFQNQNSPFRQLLFFNSFRQIKLLFTTFA